MSVVVVGLNHRTVPLELLERMTVDDARLPKALDDLASREHVSEAVVLSTCMRTEVYAVAERFHGAVQDVRNFLSELAFTAPEDFADHLYVVLRRRRRGPPLLGGGGPRLGRAGRERDPRPGARGVGGGHGPRAPPGRSSSGLFRHAVEVGKRARTETAIARGTTSVSQAAVAMATERLGSLEGRRILVLGAGEMGEGMAVALAGPAPRRADILVANRTWTKAVALAERVGGGHRLRRAGRGPRRGRRAAHLDRRAVDHARARRPRPGDGRPRRPAAAHRRRRRAPRRRPAVGRAARRDPARHGRPAGRSPRPASPSAAARSAASRRSSTRRSSRYLDGHRRARWRRSSPRCATGPRRCARPSSSGFRSRLDGLDARQREAVEALTRGIVAKLLHEPTVRLKDAAGSPRGERAGRALRPARPLRPLRSMTRRCGRRHAGSALGPVADRPRRRRCSASTSRPSSSRRPATGDSDVPIWEIGGRRACSSRRCRPRCSTAGPTSPCTRPRTCRRRRPTGS